MVYNIYLIFIFVFTVKIIGFSMSDLFDVKPNVYTDLDTEYKIIKEHHDSINIRIEELDKKIAQIEDSKNKKNKIYTDDKYIYEYEYIYPDDEKYKEYIEKLNKANKPNNLYKSNELYETDESYELNDYKPLLYLILLDDKNEYLILY